MGNRGMRSSIKYRENCGEKTCLGLWLPQLRKPPSSLLPTPMLLDPCWALRGREWEAPHPFISQWGPVSQGQAQRRRCSPGCIRGGVWVADTQSLTPPDAWRVGYALPSGMRPLLQHGKGADHSPEGPKEIPGVLSVAQHCFFFWLLSVPTPTLTCVSTIFTPVRSATVSTRGCAVKSAQRQGDGSRNTRVLGSLYTCRRLWGMEAACGRSWGMHPSWRRWGSGIRGIGPHVGVHVPILRGPQADSSRSATDGQLSRQVRAARWGHQC